MWKSHQDSFLNNCLTVEEMLLSRDNFRHFPITFNVAGNVCRKRIHPGFSRFMSWWGPHIDRSLRNPVKYPSKRSGPRSGGALHLGMIPYLTSDVTGNFHPTTNCRRKNHHHQNSSSEHPKAPELREFCLGWINFVIRSQIPSVWAKKWVEMACRGKIWATRYISDYIFSGHSEVSQK